MKTKQNILEIREEITELMDDFFVDLLDDGFTLKKSYDGYRTIEVSLKNEAKFKVRHIQSKVLMFIEYLKSQYCYIIYKIKNKKETIDFKHFPLFFYKEITEFKILITI